MSRSRNGRGGSASGPSTPDPDQARDLIESGAVCIAYETVTSDSGGLPLLAPSAGLVGSIFAFVILLAGKIFLIDGSLKSLQQIVGGLIQTVYDGLDDSHHCYVNEEGLFDNPQHPYTKKLMGAVPVADPARRHAKRMLAADEIPSPIRALDDEPVVAPLVAVGPDHFVAQHRVGGAY